MLHICDLLVNWTGELLPEAAAPFFDTVGDVRSIDLSIRCEADRETRAFLDSDVAIGVSSFVFSGNNVSLMWNNYESHSERSAVIEFSDDDSAVICGGPETSDYSVLNMLLAAFLPVVARNNGLLFHASLVEYEGRAVAFTASSGTGSRSVSGSKG